ncbi:carboxypeptidase inhibitor SmCI-like isoform X3 [Mytilus edulis]|uniref:carboxypeptidase inhibitor SmCI-like isoform X3 n=1 Tax=Mytilus edulis TaxID=6550 RepID=UPI0039EF7A7F
MHIGKPLAFLIYITLQISDAQLVDNVCDLKKDVGPCNARMSRYHYDVDSGECKQFFYGGCDGNENNFKTKQECFTDCEKRVCTLVVHYGSGGAKIKRWFYNSETMKCETFIYGGSYGNKNSFKKKRSCKKLCKGVERDPCGNIPPCIRPQPNECSDFTYDIINGVECIVGCFNSRCKQGSCPTSPFPVCTSECLLDSECAGNKLCCSGCCRSPILDNKPGTCPTDPGQQQCYGRTSECEKDSQCDGKRKCCKFSCMNFCVDPEK